MSEDIAELEDMSLKVFEKVESSPIAFKFDFEDYDHCKLNGELKKMMAYMKIKIPILQKEGKQYFIGVGFVNLQLKGAIIHVTTSNSIKEETTRFHDFIKQKERLYRLQLCFYMFKSNWSLEKVVQALYDSKPVANVTQRDLKIFKSYAESNHINQDIERLEARKYASADRKSPNGISGGQVEGFDSYI